MVPGDTVTYTNVITVNAVGDTLKANLAVDLADIAGDNDLVTAVKGSDKSTVTIGNGDAAKSAQIDQPVTVAITPSATAITIPVSITVHFPAYRQGDTDQSTQGSHDDWWGSAAQNQSIDLNNLTIELAQSLNS